MTDTKTTIEEIARSVCQPNVPELGDADKPLLDSGLDSLDYASLLMALEDKYAIQFSNEEMDGMNTVNKIAVVIDTRVTG